MKNLKINLDLFAGMLIAFGFGILIQAFISRSQGVLTHSEFGEYTGGGVATLFTLAGIFLFIQALKVQREELSAAIQSRNEANVQTEFASKIHIINGKIRANAALIESYKINNPSNSEIIKDTANKIVQLDIKLEEILKEEEETRVDNPN